MSVLLTMVAVMITAIILEVDSDAPVIMDAIYKKMEKHALLLLLVSNSLQIIGEASSMAVIM